MPTEHRIRFRIVALAVVCLTAAGVSLDAAALGQQKKKAPPKSGSSRTMRLALNGAKPKQQTPAQAQFEVTGNHIWMNGLALMGAPGDFVKVKAGTWIKTSGFDNAANNGVFKVLSVQADGSAINLSDKSGTVYEPVSESVKTVSSAKAPDPNAPPEKKEPEKKEPEKTDPPKTEPPKTDPPKTDPTKTEPPKTDPPKTDPSKTDPGKTEEKKTEPEVDPPKTTEEQQGPIVPKKVTNFATDIDLRAFLKEIASQAGVTVIPDETIAEVLISAEFQNEDFESALEKLALTAGAYWKRKRPGLYLVSKATPKASLFREFAATRMYVPKNQMAESLAAVLSPVFKEYVSVDPKMNVIGVTAPTDLLDRIMQDIALADRPSRQFVLESLVAEITMEEGEDLGFSWSWKKFAIGDDQVMTYATAGFQDIARLKALIANNKATVLANPRASAFEGRPALFTVGQETYYSLLSGNVNIPFQQIQLIKTGITLKFTGIIDDDGTITLNLEPEVSDAVVAVNGFPTTNVRRASTFARVKPGETIVIAGLAQEITDKRVVRLPFLGEIPLIGELFKRTTNKKRKTDVIMLITPRISETGVGMREQDEALIRAAGGGKPPAKKTGGG